MINHSFNYALVWASANTDKFWYKILQDLLSAWYKVIPINPKEKDILWQVVYSQLSDVPWTIDVVIFVVPPSVTEQLIDEVALLWIKNIWLQPGSESELALQKCNQFWINLIYNSCIMIQRKTNM